MSLEEAIIKTLKDKKCEENYNYLNQMLEFPVGIGFESLTWEKAINWDELISQLKKDNTYDKFDNKMQHIAFGASRVKIENLVNWLLRKSKEIGIKNTIEILNNYNTSKKMTLYVIMTIMLIRPEKEYIFSNGVIINSGDFNKKFAQDIFLDSLKSSIPRPDISSIFAFPVEKEILHTDDFHRKEEKDKDYYFALEKINNVKNCLILVRGLGGVHTMAHKYLIPDNIPLVSTARSDAWSFETFYLPIGSEPLIKIEELDEANRILNLYEALDPKFRISLKVSIERLNGYCSSSNIIERAVNLRTCLESIFLKEDEMSELSRTLALRVCKLVEQTFEKRKEKYDLIKKFYSITSKAVHRGSIPDKIKDISKLDEVAELARKVIILKIENGKEFNWEELDLN